MPRSRPSARRSCPRWPRPATRQHGVGKMRLHARPGRTARLHLRVISEELAGPPLDQFQAWLIEQGYHDVTEPQGVRGEMYYVPQRSALPARTTRTGSDRSIEYLRGRRPVAAVPPLEQLHRAAPPFSPPRRGTSSTAARRCRCPSARRTRTISGPSSTGCRTATSSAMRASMTGCHQVMKAYYCAGLVHRLQRRAHPGRAGGAGRARQHTDPVDLRPRRFLGDYDCFGKRSFPQVCGERPAGRALSRSLRHGPARGCAASLVDVMPTFPAAAAGWIRAHSRWTAWTSPRWPGQPQAAACGVRPLPVRPGRRAQPRLLHGADRAVEVHLLRGRESRFLFDLRVDRGRATGRRPPATSNTRPRCAA